MARLPEDSTGTQPYLIIFTPRLLRVLALVSLGMAALLFAIRLGFPRYFEIDIARFILCLAVATMLSIFFFIFYPQAVELNLAAKIGGRVGVTE